MDGVIQLLLLNLWSLLVFIIFQFLRKYKIYKTKSIIEMDSLCKNMF